MLKIAEKKEASGIAEYGEEDWATMPEEVTKMLSYFCSNHTRNLPVVAFNKLFNAHLAEVLGDKFVACKSASGTHARVEQNGEALSRSIAKLARDGHDLCSKGDGLLIRDWLKENYPDLIVKSVGRVELSKRQDWTLEVSAKMLALLPAITEHLIETRVLDPNVPRDSAGQRIELMHFEVLPLSLSPFFSPPPPLLHCV